MSIFKSWRSYRHFERLVKSQTRYFFDSDIEDFLNTILETAKSRVGKINAKAVLWRSQLGHDWEPYYVENEHVDHIPCPYHTERMKPLKESAIEGRANPKGIPYLYLSTDKNTALAEVRPWIGSYISLAQFRLLKDVSIVNCRTDSNNGATWYFEDEEPDPKEREIAVWRDIDEAFSKPVILNETSTDYVPTQILAELFKKNGFDGIAYRSSLGKGYNIVLFTLDVADLINCTLFRVKQLSFDFSQASNMYFISKYYKK